jgi:hypothetical protein
MPAPSLDQVPARQSTPTPPRRRRTVALLTAGTLALLAVGVGVGAAFVTRPTAPASPPAAQRDDTGAAAAAASPAAEPAATVEQPAKVEQPADPADDPAGDAAAPTPPALEDGKHAAYVRKVDAGRNTVVVDVVQVFRDRDAVEAAVKDGESRDTARFRTVYLRNENPRLRTLPLAGDLRVNLIGCEEESAASRDVLLAKLADNARSETFFYELTVDRGTVRRIDERIAGNAC